MSDIKNQLPGFKKKRHALAKTIRDYFTNMMKPKKSAIADFSLMQKMRVVGDGEAGPSAEPLKGDPRDGHNPLYAPRRSESLIAKQREILKKDLQISAPEDNSTIVELRAPNTQEKSGRKKSENLNLSQFQIKTPKAKVEKIGIQISDKGPKAGAMQAIDKGVMQPPEIGTKEIRDQTKVNRDFEIGLRWRMPKDLKDPPKKDLHKLSQWLSDQLVQIERERSDFMQRLLRYRSQWLDFVSTGMKPVWEGAHDVHIPYIFEKIKGMHSRIYQAILGIDPPFSLKPRDVVTEKQKYEKEQLLNYIVKDYANKGKGWEATIDKDILNFVSDGTGITKQSWERDVRKYSDVREDFTGFKNGVEQFTEVEEQKEEVIFDGPILKTVNIEDFYIAGVNSESPDDADLVAERTFYTKSELIKLAQQNYFYKEAIDKLLSSEPINQNQMNSLDWTTFKNQQRLLAGINSEVTGHKVYEIFEAYCRWDIDNDGIDEELVVWYAKDSAQILRMTYLERACPGAIRPYTVKRFIDRPGSPFGIGLAEMLYGINNELDYIHNQRLDYGTLQNLPFGFIRAASGSKPKDIRLAPGTLYNLDNPREDVYFPNLNGGTAYGFQEEAKVTDYGDKVTSLSGFNAGSTSAQGPLRTATGAAALVAEVNANLDIHIKRYQRGYKRNLSILDKQIQELLPLGTIIRMLGFDGKEILMQFENRKALRYQSDFELTANSVSSNKAIERDTANSLLQIIQNPLALQAGLVTPKNLYNVYRNFLQKTEIKDIDAYITRPEGTEESPYSAKDELTMILGGVKPPIYMLDRHQEKLQFFEQFEASDEFSWYTADHLNLYRETKKKHQDMMNAIQAQMPLQGTNTNGQMQSMAAAQLGAGAGAPQGVAQQQSDLMPASSPMQPKNNVQ